MTFSDVDLNGDGCINAEEFEIHRVLKPGGQLAVTDMAFGGPLPQDIAYVLAPSTCLADVVDRGVIRYLRFQLIRQN